MKALSPRVPFHYVPIRDRDAKESERSSFKLRGLTFGERCHLDDVRCTFAQDGSVQHMRGTERRLVLKCGLLGWDGFPAPFEVSREQVAGETRDVASDATLERLDVELLQELVDAIHAASRLQDDDRKNS